MIDTSAHAATLENPLPKKQMWNKNLVVSCTMQNLGPNEGETGKRKT